jgi:hypothetical protein
MGEGRGQWICLIRLRTLPDQVYRSCYYFFTRVVTSLLSLKATPRPNARGEQNAFVAHGLSYGQGDIPWIGTGPWPGGVPTWGCAEGVMLVLGIRAIASSHRSSGK